MFDEILKSRTIENSQTSSDTISADFLFAFIFQDHIGAIPVNKIVDFQQI